MLLESERAGFPTRVSEWTLSTELGFGATSRVFLGERPRLGRHARVAVKLLRPELQASSAAAIELLEEAKLMATLRHPNLVELLEAGETDGLVYLVLEYVQGTTLAELSRTAKLPDSVLARVITDALRGLHAAHELRRDGAGPAGLVHRDFSPQNILVGVDGVARLTDFGIAKAMGRLSVTRTGIVKGKVRYMSPEQACGEPLDRRSDVWAAGVVIWEALAGEPLIAADGEIATLERIVSDEPMPSLRSVRSDVSVELDAIVGAALHKDPTRRPATADELRRQLTRALAPLAEPSEVGAIVRSLAPSQPVTPRPRRSHRLMAAIAAAPVVLVVAAAAARMPDAERVAKLRSGFRLPQAPTTAASSEIPSPSPATLTVSANALIRGLSIDGLALPISAPSEEVTLSWTPGSHPADLEAESVDGRMARARLSPSARTLKIEFGNAARRTISRRKAPPPSSIGDIRLAPTPYPRR